MSAVSTRHFQVLPREPSEPPSPRRQRFATAVFVGAACSFFFFAHLTTIIIAILMIILIIVTYDHCYCYDHIYCLHYGLLSLPSCQVWERCRWFVAVSFGEGVKVVCAVVM